MMTQGSSCRQTGHGHLSCPSGEQGIFVLLFGPLERSTQADVQTAYEMLRCGSGNHIRAFVGQLEQNGATYTPQFLSADEYQVIITGSHEQCGR